MLSKFTKKRAIAVLAVVGAIGVAAAAFAFWSTSGSGNGSGSVSSTAPTTTLAGTVSGALVPGGSQSMSVTATRDATTDIRIPSITAGTITIDSGHSANCSASDFHYTGPASGQTVTHGTGTQTLASGGSLSMDNTAASQDGCQGATVTVPLSVGP